MKYCRYVYICSTLFLMFFAYSYMELVVLVKNSFISILVLLVLSTDFIVLYIVHTVVYSIQYLCICITRLEISQLNLTN